MTSHQALENDLDEKFVWKEIFNKRVFSVKDLHDILNCVPEDKGLDAIRVFEKSLSDLFDGYTKEEQKVLQCRIENVKLTVEEIMDKYLMSNDKDKNKMLLQIIYEKLMNYSDDMSSDDIENHLDFINETEWNDLPMTYRDKIVECVKANYRYIDREKIYFWKKNNPEINLFLRQKLLNEMMIGVGTIKIEIFYCDIWIYKDNKGKLTYEAIDGEHEYIMEKILGEDPNKPTYCDSRSIITDVELLKIIETILR